MPSAIEAYNRQRVNNHSLDDEDDIFSHDQFDNKTDNFDSSLASLIHSDDEIVSSTYTEHDTQLLTVKHGVTELMNIENESNKLQLTDENSQLVTQEERNSLWCYKFKRKKLKAFFLLLKLKLKLIMLLKYFIVGFCFLTIFEYRLVLT